MSFTQAPKVLYQQYFKTESDNTRTYALFQFELVSTVSGAYDKLQIDFPETFEIGTFWEQKEIVLKQQSYNVSAIKNRITLIKSDSLAASTWFSLDILAIPTPFDEGYSKFQVISAYKESPDYTVICKTYSNLNQYLTPDYVHSGPVIVVSSETQEDISELNVESGSYSEVLTATFTANCPSNIVIVADPNYPSYVDIGTITCAAGTNFATFQIGVKENTTLTEIVVQFNCTGYVPIRPIKLQIKQNKDVAINVDEIGEVKAGGRSVPKYIVLSKGPFTDLTIKLYIEGYAPTYANVYPRNITLKKGERWGVFWVSCGKNSEGTTGKVIFLFSGTNKDIFMMENRELSFTVTSPDNSPPILFFFNQFFVGYSNVTFEVVMNEPCTVYTALQDPTSPVITFNEIKKKKVQYDYLVGDAIFGEYINNSSDFTYAVKLENLKPNTEYDLQIFIEVYQEIFIIMEIQQQKKSEIMRILFWLHQIYQQKKNYQIQNKNKYFQIYQQNLKQVQIE
eukprot:TRINITY_DN7122_c0_g1_i2.p1 TRINITY_DN7122_c0_g1~~TRINITY_DN7122_c0_g1_i2.p1  ORF type:complete len:509 (-),score=64.52 TRINITY_DN7122_c0_g1_i2:1296-2822(-)